MHNDYATYATPLCISVLLWSLRSGEIIVPCDSVFDPATHLTFLDMSVDSLQSPSAKSQHKSLKADPFRTGVQVVVGKVEGSLCPVSATLTFLVIRSRGDGPLFRFADGRPLTRSRLVNQVCQALQEGGINSTPYSGHSFRIGAATTAAKEGIGDATIS